jgi:hypothetical protein
MTLPAMAPVLMPLLLEGEPPLRKGESSLFEGDPPVPEVVLDGLVPGLLASAISECQ